MKGHYSYGQASLLALLASTTSACVFLALIGRRDVIAALSISTLCFILQLCSFSGIATWRAAALPIGALALLVIGWFVVVPTFLLPITLPVSASSVYINTRFLRRDEVSFRAPIAQCHETAEEIIYNEGGYGMFDRLDINGNSPKPPYQSYTSLYFRPQNITRGICWQGSTVYVWIDFDSSTLYYLRFN